MSFLECVRICLCCFTARFPTLDRHARVCTTTGVNVTSRLARALRAVRADSRARGECDIWTQRLLYISYQIASGHCLASLAHKLRSCFKALNTNTRFNIFKQSLVSVNLSYCTAETCYNPASLVVTAVVELRSLPTFVHDLMKRDVVSGRSDSLSALHLLS